ncbi:putative transcription factor C2H2 family [Helianthus annuus]|uniref:RBR-type E3 ubiquitin transferase n=1 Tax=Helianthus annuus TaxID=4232 RepID=A0A251URY8_HELAN|nr:probable E3 ubiquitin-protein ligase ARI2 [Helianthus annuus]KAF5806589.1 putative transcription factor C2H2 family [Helianthus annuus]KAJ0585183.1 putative transcription factor C2H2 family [Helianthus annuus]KAJ0919667.1 putative transcription factor C2H2 family [Helianthus annuus]
MDSDSSDYYDDDGIDVEVSDADSESPNGSSCKVITKECLLAAQREDLQKVMDLLSLTEHHARTLLIHYRWDVDNVSEVLVNKGKDRLYEEACVTVRKNGRSSSLQSSSLTTCEVCMEEVPVNKMTTMDCGHCFCNNCWTEHFLVKINEGQSRRISCMAHKCNVVCDEGKIRINVGEKDPDLAEKFDRYILESYIEDNKRVKWCPSVPHCGYAIRVEYDEFCEVECACGVQFCFSCSSEAHSPCSCKMLELWNQKTKDGMDWIKINTKNCPKCHKTVEKHGGCNLVLCICGQPFCWLCGGATGLRHNWTSIHGHTCEEEHMAKAARAKSDSLRYMHHLDRFKAHIDSLKAETALKKKLQSKILSMEARDKQIVDYSWVTNGAERLVISRRILSYSYPFAYFMFGDVFVSEQMTKDKRIIKQNLFEQQQQQVESHIEKLSLFLAEPFDEYPEDKFKESKMKIITLTGVMDRLCKNLYDCIDNEILLDLGTTINIAPYRSKGADKAEEID